MCQTILVVDDDPLLREALTAILREEGYRVLQATDGLLALWTIEHGAPDLVLSDVAMPRLDGLELAHRLMSQPHPPPIILMSANRQPPAGGSPPFIAKPFDIDDMLRLIARVLHEFRRLRPVPVGTRS